MKRITDNKTIWETLDPNFTDRNLKNERISLSGNKF